MHMNEPSEPDHSVIAACINKRQFTPGHAEGAAVIPEWSILIRPPKENASAGRRRWVIRRPGMFPSSRRGISGCSVCRAGRVAAALNEGVDTLVRCT
ncbi:hypothetical protein E2C01_079946 [Portunus trituberculatus]|uniref:Uncharacterized protein n=1 Tax=Portunus trituberculatus TaxID=210409 RepID=A0A5B7IMT8_PORTR|nr:hypothetical protein [Portunus trituberculatus]